MVSLSETTEHVSLAMTPTASPIQLRKGTYSAEVCYDIPSSSSVKTWQKDVEFSMTDPNNIFSFLPAIGKASLGEDSQVCGRIGASTDTSENLYYTKFDLKEVSPIKAYENVKQYAPLPFFQIKVVNTKSTVHVPATIACSNGGTTVPLMITVDNPPFAGLTVKLVSSAGKSSVGLNTTATRSSLSLTPAVPFGFLEFLCNKNNVSLSGKELLYELSGLDASNYVLSNEKVVVSMVDPIDSGFAALTYNSELTTATKFAITSSCPSIGTILVHKVLNGVTHPSLTDAIDAYFTWLTKTETAFSKGESRDLLVEEWVLKDYPVKKDINLEFVSTAGKGFSFVAYCYDTFGNKTKMDNEKLFKTPKIE
jgi:hypothetical protein